MVGCNPSSVYLFPTVPTPALLMRMSNLSSLALISLANFRTEDNEAKSRYFVTIFGLWVFSIIFRLALLPSSLSARITRAPLEASTKAVWNPKPKNQFQKPIFALILNLPAHPPVTIAVLPTKHTILLHLPTLNF